MVLVDMWATEEGSALGVFAACVAVQAFPRAWWAEVPAVSTRVGEQEEDLEWEEALGVVVLVVGVLELGDLEVVAMKEVA